MGRSRRKSTNALQHNLSIVAYDPRDPSQHPDQPLTWKPTSNAALIRAFFTPTRLRHLIDWQVIARRANHCDLVGDEKSPGGG